MRRQILRLRELNERADITIRVLPLEVGAHPALTGQFAILDFAADTGIVPYFFCDGLTGGILQNGDDAVARYRACFASLSTLTLDSQQSADFFAAVADGIAASPNGEEG